MRLVNKKHYIVLLPRVSLCTFFVFFIYIRITFLFREGREKTLDSLFCENDYFPSVLFVGIKIADFTKLKEGNASLNTECEKKEYTRSYRFNSEYISKSQLRA